MAKKYLSLERLTEYDELIKLKIDTGDASTLDSAKSYADGLVGGKSDIGHTHDDRYYTETEIDTKLSTVNTSISNITSGATKVQDAAHADSATYADNATHAATSDSATEANHATTAGKLDVNAGSGVQPVYFEDGVPVATAYTLEASVPADAKFTDTVVVVNNTVDSDSTTEALSAAQGKYLNDRISAITGSMENLGGGDMMKATYDADGDGIVDKAEHAFVADVALSTTQDASGNVITSTYETKADANAKLSEAKTYADNAATAVKNDLLNGAGTAYDTLKELGDLIDDNTDAIDALEAVAVGKADAEHTHAIADVNGLQSALDGKAASSHGTHVSYSTTAPVMDGTASVGTASTVARSDHRHPTDTSRASQTDLDALETVVGNKADKTHTHTIANVTNLQSELDGKVSATDVTMKVYKNITDIGMTTASTFADVVAAVPMNAVIYIAAGALTDTSWSLPVTYGVIEIIRKGETQVAIKLHGRVGRVWIAATTTAGVPTGEWNELIRESALNSELAKKLGNSGDQEITNGSLKITSTSDTALRLDKTIDASNYVREYMILEADRARVGFGTNGEIANQMSLYADKTVFTQPVTIASGGTGATTVAGILSNLGVEAGANKYTHPTHTAKSSGLYKITVDNKGHVSAATAVAKSDITGLGIPAQDTTYSAAGSSLGLVKSGGDVTISSGVITVNDDSHNHTIANVDGLQNQLDAKVDNSKHRMTIYRSVADLGLEATATFAATVAAVPNYTTIYLNASGMSDASWNLPTSYGIIQITRRENTQLFIVFWNRIGNAYFATTSSDGVPTGVWNKVIEQNDLDSALEGKQNSITGAASSIVSNDFSNTDAVLVSNSSGKVSSASGVTKTELQTLQGIDTSSTIKNQLSGKVSKSGDTITGQLNIRHATMTQGTKPSSSLSRYVRYVDKDSNPLAYHGFYQGTSSSYFQIRAYNGLLTGTDKYAMFALGHNATNLPSCQVTSDSATFAASENGNVRNIQVQDASGANVATGKIIMKRK